MQQKSQTQNSLIAVISGVTGYVGSSIASKLASEGVTIIGLYNSDGEKVQKIFSTLNGVGHAFYQCDLKDKNKAESVFLEIKQKHGIPTICIHAAWTQPKRKQLITSSLEEVMRQVNDNITMSFNFLSEYALLFKQEGRGTIIGITTEAIAKGTATKGLGGYGVAKYALQGMLATLREELQGENIRVYSVAPDFMEGGMNNDIPHAFVQILKEKSKRKLLTTAKDVADLVAVLVTGKKVTKNQLTFSIKEGEYNL